MRLLIIEDNNRTADYLCKGLNENFFIADVARDGEEGLYMAINHPYDLIILDVMLPKMNGWELLEKIRKAHASLPILFLTACDAVSDRVKGLESGADDYLVKPFAFSELLARIRLLLRRSKPISPSEVLQIEDLRLDMLKHVATRNNVRLPLSAKEFMLLSLFMRKTGEILSRTLIAEQVWDIHFDSDSNAIDVAIKRLREKIDEGFEKKLIHSVRGVGYVLESR